MTELTTLKKLFSIILMVIGSWSVEGSFTNTDELILVMGQTYKLNVNMTSRIILGLTAPLTLDLPSPAIRIHISANKVSSRKRLGIGIEIFLLAFDRQGQVFLS